MNRIDANNLTGKCIVSSPFMESEQFQKTVVYICTHSKEGAMGFIINQKLPEISFEDLAAQLPIAPYFGSRQIDVHNGGPLDKIRGFVIHSTDYIKKDTVVIDKEIAISSSLDILNDIALGSGPRDNIITLGYSSWGPQQLEKEIMSNEWIITPTQAELVFRTKDEQKWEAALHQAGINIEQLSLYSGRA